MSTSIETAAIAGAAHAATDNDGKHPEIPARDLAETLAAQRAAFAAAPYPLLEDRLAALRRLKTLLVDNQQLLAKAISRDFGSRSVDETRLAELLTAVEGINFQLKHLRRWMTPDKRKVGLLFAPASNQIIYQPLGVVGILVPWNYPLMLAIGPLATALAAGNRAMLKLSEYTPHFNDCLNRLLAEAFAADEVAVITGDADVAAAFSRLPFDHLLFTGSTGVGRHVMRAAADNLTPVTLELGGKSPVLIAKDANLQDSADRICFGKSLNAGQTCIAPDYILCPADQIPAFIEAYRRTFARMYPDFADNADYSAIINDSQYQRLQELLEDARSKGATLHPMAANGDAARRKMAPVLITGTTEEMTLMQQELFGPLLPVVPYTETDEAIAYINARPRPLALYLFSEDPALQQQVLHQTHSGGVTINNTLTHIAQEDMPFGGIGPSGMGHYHGHEGFLTFSKAKAVHRIGRLNGAKLAYPPYNKLIHKLIYRFFIR